MRGIAILGAGMAGLLAAKALRDCGHREITIYDKSMEAKRLRGLHYLHDDCGLIMMGHYISNLVVGCSPEKPPAAEYAKKIFGGNPPPSNSVQTLPAYNKIYSMDEAHLMLLHRYAGYVVQEEISRKNIRELCKKHKFVISTIPAPILFDGEFPCEKVQVKAGLPSEVQPLVGLMEHFTVYNVREDENWYRASRVFGEECTEVKAGGDFQILKIKDGNFRNNIPNLHLAGRYGTWRRGYLVHDAYYTVKEFFGWKNYHP